jgi:hypothetical protein
MMNQNMTMTIRVFTRSNKAPSLRGMGVILTLLVASMLLVSVAFAQAGDAFQSIEGRRVLRDYEELAASVYGRWTSLGSGFDHAMAAEGGRVFADYDQLAASVYGRWTSLGGGFDQAVATGIASSIAGDGRVQLDYEQRVATTYGRWTSLGAQGCAEAC